MCDKSYKRDEFHPGNVAVDNRGVQTYVVPAAGDWTITAYGASGGMARHDSAGRSGRGAAMTATFKLKAGDKMHMVVGQHGGYFSQGVGAAAAGGGGGGGTFIWLNDDKTPILVSGGGGGASYYGDQLEHDGQPGQDVADGSAALPAGGAGGKGGDGGVSSESSTSGKGGAGGGWKSDGNCFSVDDHMVSS